jgi:signal transduction histidine kinase
VFIDYTTNSSIFLFYVFRYTVGFFSYQGNFCKHCELGNKDIKIVISKPKQKTICYADSERVMQIVVNLIGNSFKFTEKGSIKITFKVTKDSVTTYVSDTGRGISTENQKLLFRKFQQASDNLFTRDTTKGTGLGLYISKLMIEGMKGSIWLEKSEVNKGSVFAFSLPTS